MIMMMMIQFTKQIIQGINISLANKAGPLHPPGSFTKEQVSRCTWAAVQVGMCPPLPHSEELTCRNLSGSPEGAQRRV